jgi:hypothetical protein
MERIDLSKYMTVAELRAEIGCSQRVVWRVIDRVGRERCCIKLLNATLVKKSMLEELRSHYYPYYSEAHQAMVKEWGAQGGATKAANAAAAEEATKRRGRKQSD